MRKVKTNRRNRIFGLFAMFAMAIGVGVSLAPKEALRASAATAETTFGATSGAIGSYWSFRTVKGSETSAPAWNTNSSELRMYYHSSGNGGSVIFEQGTDKSATLTKIVITASSTSYTTKLAVKYGPDSSNLTTVSNPTWSGATYTLEVLAGFKYVSIQNANTTNTQLRLKGAELTYDVSASYDPATSVSVTAADGATTVGIGKKLQLSAVVNPKPGANQAVTWTASNANATVDALGEVTGAAAGSVTITATSTTPGKSGSINLTVVDPYAGYDGVERFESQTALTTSYASGSFEGANGATFTYTNSRDEGDHAIDGKGLMLRYADSYLEISLPNGLSKIEFEYRKAFTGGSERQLELYVNNVLAKLDENKFGSTLGEETTVYTFTYTPDEGVPGPATVKIKNTGSGTSNKQITIDNVVWMDGPELVEAVLQSISLNTTAVKKVFYVGEKFTSNGLVVTATDSANPPFLVEDYDILPEEGYRFVAGEEDDELEVIVEVTIDGVTKDASYYIEVRAARMFNAANEVHFGRIYSFGATHTVGEETVTIAMSTGVTSNQPQSVPVDLASGSYTEVADMLTVKLLPGSKAGTYALEAQEGSNAGKYLRAQVTYKEGEAPTAATDIRFADDINDESSWTINFEEGKLRVRNYVVPGRFISGNPSTNRFALLASLQGGSEPYLYEDNSSVNALVEATVFVDAVNDGMGEGAEGACHEAFGYLEFIFDQLSEDAFDVLVDSEDQAFLDAIERYQYLEAWTAANPEPGAPGSVISPNNENAPLNATLIIGLLGLTTIAGYYFLSKKEKLVK